MQYWVLLLLAFMAGILMPTQAAVNHRMATALSNPVLAAFVSFGVGMVSLLLYLLISGIPLSQLQLAKNAPAIAWTGGLMGAVYVAVVTYIVPRLGVALTFSVLIAGNLFITLLLDHVGFLGIPVKPVNLPRLLGVVLVLAGVLIFRKY
jgi:bacterial/archaeal transporter family-2 protein